VVRRPTAGEDGATERFVDLQRVTSPRAWKLDESWKRRITSRREPVRSARQQATHPEVRIPEAGQGAGPVKQNIMKIWPGPKTCLQLVLFEKAFPSSCQAQFMQTQML
jgi:hypothetical protein